MPVQTALDTGWVLTCAALVFVMQAGFCCLECGTVRAKNSINVAIKNLVDFSLSGLLFWGVGFALIFGMSWNGLIGTSWPELKTPFDYAFFLFQLMFCGAATTIVSGAIAERMRFSAYLILAALISAVIYPVSAHWVWGSALTGSTKGWLEAQGFIDFAGSTVVHAVGGAVGLAACLVIGPRRGRFDDDSESVYAHNLPLATLGVILLWFGWFGFNGGSALGLTADVPRIITNTVIAGMAGSISALLFSAVVYRRPDVSLVMNGSLAGLVAITACCHVVDLPGAACVGLIGGLVATLATTALERLKIDDVVGAFPVHTAAGFWGTLCVALFGNPTEWGTGLSQIEQFLVQLKGATACTVWAFGSGWLILAAVNRLVPLRVTEEEEERGLNIAEHGASSELLDLVGRMEHQRRTGDFSEPIPLESETEVGQIAAQYNRVLTQVHNEQSSLLDANRQAEETNSRLQVAQSTLRDKLRELREFNEAAVNRELRMVELKEEVNSLHNRAGEDSRYDVSASGKMEPVNGGTEA